MKVHTPILMFMLLPLLAASNTSAPDVPTSALEFQQTTNSRIVVEENFLRFYTGAMERMTIDSNGNVAIGSATPSTLDVSGQISIDGQKVIDSNSTDIMLGDLASGDGMRKLVLRAGDQDRMFITNEGKVGIGTDSPNANLEIKELGSGVIPLMVQSKDVAMKFTIHAFSLEANPSFGYVPYIQWLAPNGNRQAYLGWEKDFFNLRLENGYDFGIIGGDVGIGTNSPATRLHVRKAAVGVKSTYAAAILEATDAQLDVISSSAGTWGSSINLIEGNTTSNKDIWSIVRQTTGGDGNSSLRFNFGTNNNHTNSNKLTINKNGYVGIGTSSPSYKLHVSGTVRATTFSASNPPNWPDYVFEDTYELNNLKDVEKYIEKNHHLPEIPSAAEVEANGLDIVDMQAKLLQKIEELTLYVIELKKENESQSGLLQEQQKQIEKLKRDAK